MKSIISILWFKRDLRLHDNLALLSAIKAGFPVLPLYVVEPNYWQQPFSARRHWHFIQNCLEELRDDCIALGQPLVVRKGTVTEVLNHFRDCFQIHGLFSHEESGNFWTFSEG